MPSTSASRSPEAQPIPGIFRVRPVGSWVAIGVMAVVIVICWASFLGFIQPIFEGQWSPPRIEADSSTYFKIAGVLHSTHEDDPAVISFQSNLFGPVLIAKILHYPVLVFLFNLGLLALMVYLASEIPGVRRRYFLILFFLNAESFVSIVSLNKEILASVGIVAFAAAVTNPARRKRFLVLAIAFSVLARWEQIAIIFIYKLLESRFSPFRQRHKLALLFLLGMLTVAYSVVVRYSGIDVGGFVAVAQGGGVIARLDDIQSRFGLPLVILPKALMNMFNRILTPSYFISPDFLKENFSDLQENVIIHLHTLAMLAVSATALIKGRLGFSRPLPYLIYLYLMITSVSPFIQPRYDFPVYSLFCILCAIDPVVFAVSRPAQPARRRLLTLKDSFSGLG